ncbi:hypothetical protein MKW94_027031, partial [Papaver nudicaule]|nr:hypothetical protein [Papaver nudicaule]
DTERTLAAATERWRKMFFELEKRRKKTVVAEGDRSLEVIDEIGTELPATTTTSDKSE